jgi:N,N'-diacetyllegionaminate synthase
VKRVLFIAEAGVNHNGSIDLAKKLIDGAASAGVDYVKFQYFKASKLVRDNTPKAAYQAENDSRESNQDEMLRRLELTLDDHRELSSYCKTKGVDYLCTPFDNDSARELKDLVPFYKVSSGDLNNFPLLKVMVSMDKPIVLSTGMATLEEIEVTVEFLKSEFFKKSLDINDTVKVGSSNMSRLSVLHCTTSYPTKFEDVNLLAMKTIEERFKITVGYSDHTLGLETPLAAVALGASIIEKHFTLDQQMEGPDHSASLPINLLPKLVSGIHSISLALGDGKKELRPIETENAKVAKKGLYYAKNFQAGHILKEGDLKILRPMASIGPESYFDILGKELLNGVEEMAEVKKDEVR